MMRSNWFTTVIKIISTIVMIMALALVLFNLSVSLDDQILLILKYFAIIAIVIHLIEGILAGIIAHRQGLNPIKSGIYTFFTGTITLLEMWPLSPKNQV